MRFTLYHFPDAAAVRALHGVYGSLREEQLEVLWRLFHKDLPGSLHRVRKPYDTWWRTDTGTVSLLILTGG